MPYLYTRRAGIALVLGLGLLVTSFGLQPGIVKAAGAEDTLPIIPTIDATMAAHLQTILQAGMARGNHADVFAKVGDSISESGSFLGDLGDPQYDVTNLGAYSNLASTITYFDQATFPASYTGVYYGIANSFSAASPTAVAGWTVGEALDPAQLDSSYVSTCPAPYNTPLACELHRLNPGFAIIMYGTNDLIAINNASTFHDGLTTLVQQVISNGTVPILSTIPPRLDASDQGTTQADLDARVAAYNQAVAQVASEQDVPVMNFWKALQPLPHFGIDTDNVHPNAYQGGNAAIFTTAGLNDGYNVRNLLALQTLAALKSTLVDHGTPAPIVPVVPITPPTPPAPPVVPPAPVPAPTSVPTIPASFFTLSVPVHSATIQKGKSQRVTLKVTRAKKFVKAIHLHVAGLPSGVSVSLSLATSGSGSVTFHVNNTAHVGTYHLTIQAISATHTEHVAFTLNIVTKSTTPPPPTPVPTPTPSPTPVVSTSTAVAMIAGCQVFPADNAWNEDVSTLPVRSDSNTFINAIGADQTLHPDFGQDQSYGIPFNVVSDSQPKVAITFTAYGDESDPGPYPIPPNAVVEAGNDHHVLVLDKDTCVLYEMYHAVKDTNDNGWSADSGAVWNLRIDATRPLGWTSADAAGLPILPGLVRYDEVAAGQINHAIRFTVDNPSSGYILPASHRAGSDDASLPPMGLRVRLKASYDISHLTGQALVIAQAMKKYGMIVADDGSSWFFQGATDPRWNDDQLNELKSIPGSAFEAVDTGPIH